MSNSPSSESTKAFEPVLRRAGSRREMITGLVLIVAGLVVGGLSVGELVLGESKPTSAEREIEGEIGTP